MTASYGADREAIIKLLNDSLATELVCVLRYRRHYFMAKGLESKSIAEEFLAHSNEELGHADLLAERIVQLGGEPDFSPDSLSGRSRAEYIVADSLVDMIKENLIAERIAIQELAGVERASTGNSDLDEMLGGGYRWVIRSSSSGHPVLEKLF